MWTDMLSILLNYPDPTDGEICNYKNSPLPELINNMKEAIGNLDS